MNYLALLSLPGNFFVFALSATGVWLAGTRLTYLVDALAERYKIEKSLVGLLVLSLATSLPEVATTLSAAVEQSQQLVLNNLFGGVALQTAILATADIWARGAITNYPRKANHALEATMLVVLLAMTMVVLLVGDPISIGHIGVGSLAIGAVYAVAIWLLRRYEAINDWVPVDLPEGPEDGLIPPMEVDETTSDKSLLFQAAAASFLILVLGIALVLSAEQIAFQTGLGEGFVAVTLLAAATSLPELTTSITAVRMGAYTMAISNIFGSNLIMLVLVLPADILYFGGPILRDSGPTVMLAVCFGILVTAIYLVGLIVRRKPRVGSLGVDSLAVIVVFLISLLAYYAVI